jgi:hypothetical protein
VNVGALRFVPIMNEHKETRQTGCAHESTDFCLYAERDDLQAGKGRSLQDTEEKETLQGTGRRLRIGTFLPSWQKIRWQNVSLGS